MPEIDWYVTAGVLWEWLTSSSPWLAPLLWVAFAIVLIVLWVKWKGWAKVKAIAKWFQRAIALVDQLLTLPDDVRYIRGQLSNNGGSTVKDVGQTTAKQTAENAKAIARLERKLGDVGREAGEAKAVAGATQTLLIEHLTLTKE